MVKSTPSNKVVVSKYFTKTGKRTSPLENASKKTGKYVLEKFAQTTRLRKELANSNSSLSSTLREFLLKKTKSETIVYLDSEMREPVILNVTVTPKGTIISPVTDSQQ